MVGKKYVDVNVFVYWLAGEGEFLERAKQWIKKIENSEKNEYITSALSLYKLIVIMAGVHRKTLKNKKFVQDILEPILYLNNLGLKIVPLTSRIFEKALKAMNKHSLDFEDALHYATAKENKVETIISNDNDFNKTDLKAVF